MELDSNSKIETMVRELLCQGESTLPNEKIVNIHKIIIVDKGNKYSKMYNLECLVYLFSLNEIFEKIITKKK